MTNESGGVFIGADKRSKHIPHNKTKDEDLQKVRQHIESFPAVEGHYTRKASNRKYLGAELNIPKMYQLYLENYKDKVPENSLVRLVYPYTGRPSTRNTISPFTSLRRTNVMFVSAIIEAYLMDPLKKMRK
jgi:hypothetical protein